MSVTTLIGLQNRLSAIAHGSPERAREIVQLILEDATGRAASDVHFEPTHRSIEIRYRLDGVLQTVAALRILSRGSRCWLIC
jgi:type II secretory ATPase GspE/PulE/Tfp pilus assembly ATPase PilB-like protein